MDGASFFRVFLLLILIPFGLHLYRKKRRSMLDETTGIRAGAEPAVRRLRKIGRPFTRQMVAMLKEIPGRGWRQRCAGCGQRNSIGNLFFCLACGEIRCWHCIGSHAKDAGDGQRHALCHCGNFLKSHDSWLAQAQKAFPEDFPPPRARARVLAPWQEKLQRKPSAGAVLASFTALGLAARVEENRQGICLDLSGNTLTPDLLQALIGEPDLHHVQALLLNDCALTDAQLQALLAKGMFGALQHLSLRGNRLSNHALLTMAHTPTLRFLQRLEIDGNAIDDTCLQQIRALPANRLWITQLDHIELAGRHLAWPKPAPSADGHR